MKRVGMSLQLRELIYLQAEELSEVQREMPQAIARQVQTGESRRVREVVRQNHKSVVPKQRIGKSKKRIEILPDRGRKVNLCSTPQLLLFSGTSRLGK